MNWVKRHAILVMYGVFLTAIFLADVWAVHKISNINLNCTIKDAHTIVCKQADEK